MENKDILEIIKNIDKHIKYIENKKIETIEILENSEDTYLAVSMSVFTLINNLIELGDEIIKVKNLEFPRKYRDIAIILHSNKIIEKNQQNILVNFIKIRNNIAHEYDVSIKYEDILYVIKNINFFKDIIGVAKQIILK